MHRDIKLENLLIDNHGTIKIDNFKYALRKAVHKHPAKGTLQYMAPE